MVPKGVNQVLGTLDQLPKGMRGIAIASMVHFTAGLEASGQLPKGATNKLIDRLEDRWGELPKKVEKQAQKLADGVKKGTDRAANIAERYGRGAVVDAERSSKKVAERWEWGFGKVPARPRPRAASSATTSRQSFWGGANASRRGHGPHGRRDQQDPEVARRRKGQGRLRRQVRQDGSNSEARRFQAGGMVARLRHGRQGPRMLEPGEVVINRKAVAAMGGREGRRVNKMVPRFAKGGEVGAAGWRR